MKKAQIVIYDLGCQYTQLIARVLLMHKVQSVILTNPGEVREYLKENKPNGIILSGSNFSVYNHDAPEVPEEIFSCGCPILGICYGMQYIAYRENKKFVRFNQENKGYGAATVFINESPLFVGLDKNAIKVWTSHGDSVLEVPNGFTQIAESSMAIEGIQNLEKNIFALQFHPEVIETQDDDLILKNFALTICNCVSDWENEDTIATTVNEAKGIVAGGGKIGLGLSGGVDSMTLGKILSVLGDKLFAFIIDTGGMRLNEIEDVAEACRGAGIPLHVIDAKHIFLEQPWTTIDAEEKRAFFKACYQQVFKRIILENGITYMAQGTLATDLIESGKSGNSKLIKSHHNTGLDFAVPEFTPFKHLFKYQIREIARSLGLNNSISERKPFPGPGLFIRAVGIPVTNEVIERIRMADAIVTNILKKDKALYDSISQLIVGQWSTKTVGIKGSERVYEYPCAVRTVFSTDFMTVKGARFPVHIQEEIESAITQIEGFNRVVYDWTTKPPASTEWE